MPSPQDHITNQEWIAFRRRSLSNDELRRVSEHLNACESCRHMQRLAASRDHAVRPEVPEIVRESAAAVANPHLTFEQLSAYLDGTPGSPEWAAVEEHLSFCSACIAEWTDLRTFEMHRRHESVVPAKAESGLWAAIRNFFATPQSPAFTGAAAALAMAGFALLMLGSTAALPGLPETASTTSEMVRAQSQVFDLRSIGGGLLAAAGLAGFAYRFSSSRSADRNGPTR